MAHLDLMPVLAVPSAAFEVPSPGGALSTCFVPWEAAVFALCHGFEAMMLRLRHASGLDVLRFEVRGSRFVSAWGTTITLPWTRRQTTSDD